MPANAEQRAAFVLRPGFLDSQKLNSMRAIRHDSPHDVAKEIEQDIQAGRASVLYLQTGEELKAFCIYEIEREELHIMACMSSDPTERDLTPELLSQLEAFGKEQGCHSMRFHTMRHGLILKAIEYGMIVSEVTIEKKF